jgi:hypothetical protein
MTMPEVANNAAPKAEKAKKIEEYEIDDAVRTLLQAEEIKQKPELMKLVSKKLQAKKKAINSLADLQKINAKMPGEDEEEE